MKILIFIISFLLLSAQAQDLSWGAVQSTKDAAIPRKVLAIDDTGFYSVHEKGNLPSGFFLKRFDLNNKLIYTKNFAKELEKGAYHPFVFPLGKDLYLGWRRVVTKPQRHEYFYQKIDQKTGNLIGEQVQLASESATGRNRDDRIYSSRSPDSSKTALYFRVAASAEDNPRKNSLSIKKPLNCEIIVLHKDGSIQWKKDIVFDYGENKNIELESFQLDNEGRVHMSLSIENVSKPVNLGLIKAVKTDFLGISLQFVSFDSEGYKYREIELLNISPKDLSKTNLGIDENHPPVYHKMDPEGNITFFGISAHDQGSVRISYLGPEDTELSEPDIADFSEEEKKLLENFRYSFVHTGLVFMDDGSKTIVAQSAWARIGETQTLYQYGNIFCIRLDAKNRILWTKVLEIGNSAVFPSYGGHFLGVNGDELILVHNSSARNANKDVMLTRISADGEEKTTPLFDKDKEMSKYLIHPRSCARIANGHFIVVGGRLKEFRYASLKF